MNTILILQMIAALAIIACVVSGFIFGWVQTFRISFALLLVSLAVSIGLEQGLFAGAVAIFGLPFVVIFAVHSALCLSSLHSWARVKPGFSGSPDATPDHAPTLRQTVRIITGF